MKPARHCDECQHWHGLVGIPGERCDKGHVPRFYQPRGPMDQDWGWKRRCEDFTARADEGRAE